jgi:hypothetical protein
MTPTPEDVKAAPDMTDFEFAVLRAMAGEEVPHLIAGAAMWTAAAWLMGHGYVQGHYTITQKGRDYLAAAKRRAENV